MSASKVPLFAALAAFAFFFWPRKSAPQVPASPTDQEPPVSTPSIPFDPWLDVIPGAFMPFNPPASAALYLPALRQAEAANGIPDGLLVRLAYQESRFRPDVIDGRVRSSAGAVGIMQIVPRWHPNVNPLDPFASIGYAAAFLRQNFNRFGNWRYALAAYNWGPGNVSKWIKGGASPPLETQNYMAQILSDVPGVA